MFDRNNYLAIYLQLFDFIKATSKTVSMLITNKSFCQTQKFQNIKKYQKMSQKKNNDKLIFLDLY